MVQYRTFIANDVLIVCRRCRRRRRWRSKQRWVRFNSFIISAVIALFILLPDWQSLSKKKKRKNERKPVVRKIFIHRTVSLSSFHIENNEKETNEKFAIHVCGLDAKHLTMANIEDGDSFDSSDNGEMEEEVPKRKMIALLKV